MASSKNGDVIPHYLLHCNETRRNLARKRLVKVSLPRAVTQPEVRCSSRSRCCRDRWRALSPRTPDARSVAVPPAVVEVLSSIFIPLAEE